MDAIIAHRYLKFGRTIPPVPTTLSYDTAYYGRGKKIDLQP